MAKKTKSHRYHKAKDDRDQPQAKPRGVRPFWSGTISFGLVSVPVYLFPASRGSRAGLRMLDESGTPLARRYFCPAHGKMVDPEQIVRGYEIDDGEYVVVTDEELESLEPQKSREIDLMQFVDLRDIPPLLLERTYILTPSGETNKAYRLLAEVIEETDRAGIATFVMRDREYLVAITAADGILRAHTLRFEDEVRRPEELDLPAPAKPKSRAVEAIEEEIAKLSVDKLRPADFRDEYEERLQKLVARKKSRGEDIARVEDEELPVDDAEDADDAEEIDLLETIRRNLAAAQDAEPPPARHKHNGHGGLEEQSREELYEHATKLEIAGRSKMTKSQLIRALRRREG
jgi:DNA end-binding protein Ku